MSIRTAATTCPVCGEKYDTYRKDVTKALQHHLWGGHRMEVIKSHDVAKRFTTGEIDDEEMLELKQMALPNIL